MQKRRTRLLAALCAAAVVAFCLPVCASVYLAWSNGHAEANGQLELFATQILQRAATLRSQSNAVIDQLAGSDPPGCTAADMDRMRKAAASASYLQGIGRMNGNVLLCSTLTGDQPVDVGQPDRSYPVNGSPAAWDGVLLPSIAQSRFAITARAGVAAISLPELVSDIPVPDGVVVGQFAIADQKVMRTNGAIDADWLRPFTGPRLRFDDEHGNRVILKRSDLGYTAAVAAMPLSLTRAYVLRAAERTLPAGIAVGALLALAVVLWMRYRWSLKARLREALRRREFHLVYQPVIDMRTERCVGAEALVRWKQPDGSLVSPVVFIPAAERHGLIRQVTAQVIDIVARDAVALLATHPDAHIAINFSADDLHSPETGARLTALLQQAGARSSNIMIEATERGLMKPEKAKGTLVSVRAQGFKVAIDDFGTGSSSLSYLATYELDVLKIDKMFVDAFEQDDSPTTKVALHIIGIAKTLGLEMVAEGVETQRQRDLLRDAGVQYAQGWYYAKPMSMEDLVSFMQVRNKG